MQVDVTVDPSPPAVGQANLLLTVTDAKGQPIEGATVHVEGNMNHAGMKPSFAETSERQPGQYAGKIDFTMGGDWFLLVTTTMPDGKSVVRKIDLPGVQSP